MKIYVTGHTSGLGKEIYKYYTYLGETVEGMSRSNGYDLDCGTAAFVRNDFDLYINNAYSNYAQVDLLYRLFETNQGRDCTIINIGSVSADGNKDYPNQYAVHKAALEKACSQLQLIDTDCRVVHVKLGRMATPMTDHCREYPRIDTLHIARVIDWVAHQPRDILVKNLTLDVMHSRRKLVNPNKG